METIRFDKMDIKKISSVLKEGGILAFPTDTVFGLGCLNNEEAIKKIYEAKGRDFNKPLPMMVSNLEMLEKVAYVNENVLKIFDRFTPGPLTVVLRKKENIKSHIGVASKTIAIRIPDDEWILKLINYLNEPLFVTSANISNTGSLLSYKDVLEEMDNKIDGIVLEDARGSISSTIIDMSEDEIKLLRQGPIDINDLKGAIHE